MNINRDNYEEYFLLYADNELTDFEKAEVLMFVKNHKDLEEEFRMIHYTISKPEAHVQLTDKSFLFRNTAASFINEKNYEEVFVLYHDNELTETQKLETEKFVAIHKELKNEFDLIGLARLTPESSVVFAGKKILYKKEKSGKVIPIMFRRMLAAAAFIGFGLWIMNLYFQKPVQRTTTTAHSVPSKNSFPKIKKNSIPEKNITKVVAQSSDQPAKNPRSAINDKKDMKRKDIYQKNNNAVAKAINNQQKSMEENISSQLPGKINDEPLVSNREIKNISNESITAINKIDPSKELVQNDTENNNDKAAPETYTTTDSYVTDANINNQNYVFYDVSTDKFKKTKLSGFLKKVRRVVERTNPIARLLTGDDRQVVSK